MRFHICLGGLAALVAAAGISARFLADSPPATTLNPLLAARQATPTTTVSLPRRTLTPDPWQCVTENITQYFDVPKPTGNVLDAINSYAAEVNKACLVTAVGYQQRSCTMSDIKLWCGFTTAAPADVLSSYSSYASEVVSFWTAKSSMISILSTSCPVAWGRHHMADHEWQRIAGAHANCYLAAHSQTQSQSQTQTQSQTHTGTETTAPTGTVAGATTSTTPGTSKANLLGRAQTVEAMALVSAGLAVLANAA
ncbi:uncharacterized protein B0T15DRAFT_496293 [Chaetomium strumarium]|uniref:DUF7735 domain-containing protein n=1 Tax=Chaetomium strumarium TaxID=1170767 RepID=A0AAJ0GPJ5_9PEZI|nr:hypothetical protein B0T15DRAFT_496293 [Chaetomium strumarium]